MSTFGSIIENAQTPGGVAGTLALGIMVTLCWVYVHDPSGNPEIEKTLTYAFVSIVGFYFGTTSKGTNTTSTQNTAPPPVIAPAPPAPDVDAHG